MKSGKSLIAVAVVAGLAVPGMVSAEPKVYGKFNIALDNEKVGDADAAWLTRDNKNSSRLGVKGSEELGLGELKAIYKMEWGVDPFGNESSAFSERNIFVGLEGGFGTVQFGKYDTPVKEVGSSVDQFNDVTNGDIDVILKGESRLANMVQYTSPKLADMLTFALAVQPGNNRPSTDNSTDASENDRGLADTMYASVSLDAGPFGAAVAYAGNEVSGSKIDGATLGLDILRAVATFKQADFEGGLLFQTASGVSDPVAAPNGDDVKETSMVLSAGYTVEAFKFKGQYGTTKGDRTDDKLTELALGVDYKLSKNFSTGIYNVNVKRDSTDVETKTFGLQLVYSF